MLEIFLDAQRQRLLSALNVQLASGTHEADAAVARLALVAAQIQARSVIPCSNLPVTSSARPTNMHRNLLMPHAVLDGECTVQETVCTAGELFLATHQGFHRQALLPAKARDEGMSAGELLFDKLPGADDSADEASSWEVQMPMSRAFQDVVQLNATGGQAM